MGFSIEMNGEIITHNHAERLGERTFRLVKDGYHLYPLDSVVAIQTEEKRPPFGTAVITKVEWSSGRTTLFYELISLTSVN
ncbi:DUF2584 family protein [Salibacterium halotolerans]|uniref:DUF2584 domain-containing protein n=1 Tax=Salibacterium halotolerans TaxID=1884432 RepID=A0A1I5TT91_9BACI|nr:DUF2584 family protein [Salibacterium halotolerans]SFP86274.1 Protein of unknown function [Salibacterium halotolerans]